VRVIARITHIFKLASRVPVPGGVKSQNIFVTTRISVTNEYAYPKALIHSVIYHTMMEIATPHAALDGESIPLVQAVYIDRELMEVHPDNIAVSSDTSILVAAVVADDVSPSRFSACTCVNSDSSGYCECTDNSAAGAEEVASLTSVTSPGEHRLQASFHQNQHQVMVSSHSSSVGSDDDDGVDESQVLGAGAAGAVVGFLMGGPLLCMVLGLGSLYCSQQEGAAGDIARAMGDVALLTHSRFVELNEKHHLVDKGKEAASKAMTKLKEAEERHRRRRSCKKKVKFRKFVAWCWKSLVDFENKHKLLGRMCQKTKDHLDALVKQYLPDNPNESSDVQ
jgi:hypothetical protein